MGCGSVNLKYANLTQDERAQKISGFIRLFEKTKDDAALKEAFDCFDINSDNKLTYKELKTIMKALGESGEGAEIAFEYDANHDGFLNYEEFCEFIKASI
jgi:Ca2+-binding EF-hand superfamily protein